MNKQVGEDTRLTEWDGALLLQSFQAAEQWLKQHIPAINALNVFPVPDGDTGTNMHMTLEAALRDVPSVASCALVSERIYRGALMAARGNSGVILSQILRGIAQSLAEHTFCGPVELANALVQASATAYRGASEPREGTMLTVIRETGEAAQMALTHTNADLLTVLAAAVEGARASVERTPTLLNVLREAGVVDAGGQGLYIILEGMLRWARGEAVSLAHDAAIEQEFTVAFKDVHDTDDFGYCTNVLLQGEKLPFEEIRRHITAAGTSVVVVGDEALVRIHVHTLRPGDILNYAIQFGELLQIEISNMDQQRAALRLSHNGQYATNEQSSAQGDRTVPGVHPFDQRESELLSPIGVVAVVPGEGFAAIFRSFRVGAIVMGGQTMNPSTQDLLEAIESLPQREIIVLPNNSNIIMAARQAAALTDKQVSVIPSKTVPQGIAAMMGFGYQRNLDENVVAMQREIERVVTAEITTAVRDALIEGQEVRGGQTIALLNGELVAAYDDRDQLIDDIMARMDLESLEILTIYYGQEVSAEQAEELAARLGICYPEHAVEVKSGGQPLYDYIFAAE